MKIYQVLVNRHAGIAARYHRVHDGAAGFVRLLSWAYLLWLNFCYYVLFCHYLAHLPGESLYERKRLPVRESESALCRKMLCSATQFAEKLEPYDVISFDVFDTLLFRPFDQPADLFYLVGERLGLLDFRSMRIRAEQTARERRLAVYGDREVTLREIWAELKHEAGNGVQREMRIEMETELSLCYGNPFMKEVWNLLRGRGKRIILLTDMYLPGNWIQKMLCKAGFHGYESLFLSCKYRMSKADGRLFRVVRTRIGDGRAVHVGDNGHSDVDMARRAGFDVLPYPAANRFSLLYRPYDMSCLIGSAYRGITAQHLYNGLHVYSMTYEFGYIYGGLFVTGYCRFIHDYCRVHGIDRILFFSRDGDILKKAYDLLYPGERTVYARWSRKAAVKLMAGQDWHDFFRRFLDHKTGQGYTIHSVLHAMDLEFLLPDRKNKSGQIRGTEEIDPEEELTVLSAERLRRFLRSHTAEILDAYQTEHAAAKQYYLEILHGSRSAAAVDIGWAGSGALSLSFLAERVWAIPCRIIGIVAGTNTVFNAEPDASEPFLQSEKLVSYLYSQRHNRDILKKHDPNRDYNIYWELLLSSTDSPLDGFSQDGSGHWEARFGVTLNNEEEIQELQRGILDFVRQYQTLFRAYPYMMDISGRDAYAPMLLAASFQERYLKAIRSRFEIRANIE